MEAPRAKPQSANITKRRLCSNQCNHSLGSLHYNRKLEAAFRMEPFIMPGYMSIPHDAPPLRVAPPRNFDNVELYPLVTLTANRTVVSQFNQVVKKQDELGECLVTHFEVGGTLIVFYQSALDAKDHWTVFADMRGCVEKQQIPTKLGSAVLRYLSAGSIKADWVNEGADTEYRSRRRKMPQIGRAVVRVFRSDGVMTVKTDPQRNSEKFANPLSAARKPAYGTARSATASKAAAPKTAAVKNTTTSVRSGGSSRKPVAAKKTYSKK